MRKIVSNLLMGVVLFSACTEDIEQPNGSVALTVIANAENFTPANGADTRTSEELYLTKFTGGEQIGVTMVKEGKIVDEVDNICFTYEATTNKWTTDSPLPISYYQDVTYLAYYPYDAGMNGKVSEQGIIDAFTPQTDQSTYANYTKSDLMVATGTADPATKTLSLPFRHAMAMISVSVFAKTFITTEGYKYTPGDNFAVRNLTETAITVEGSLMKPCLFNDGTFRVIVTPDATEKTINIKYRWVTDLMDYTDAAKKTLAAGKYTHYKLKMPESLPYVRDIQPGDYYFNNGNIQPNDTEIAEADKKNCIGLVFYSGRHPSDSGTYTDKNGAPMDVHGYVIIAAPNVYPCAWGSRYTDKPDGVGTSTSMGDYMGYDNTKKIKAKALSKNPSATETSGLSTDAENNYPATYYAIYVYEKDCPSPAGSSGWFLPSYKQIDDVKSLQITLTNNLNKLGRNNLFDNRYTWTSTEAGMIDGEICYGYNLNTGMMNPAGKEAWYSSIAALAF